MTLFLGHHGVGKAGSLVLSGRYLLHIYALLDCYNTEMESSQLEPSRQISCLNGNFSEFSHVFFHICNIVCYTQTWIIVFLYNFLCGLGMLKTNLFHIIRNFFFKKTESVLHTSFHGTVFVRTAFSAIQIAKYLKWNQLSNCYRRTDQNAWKW